MWCLIVAIVYKETRRMETFIQHSDWNYCITRFYQEPVAMMADVEAMFHQVKGPPDDADLMQILWLPEGDTNSTMAEYGMVVAILCRALSLKWF